MSQRQVNNLERYLENRGLPMADLEGVKERDKGYIVLGKGNFGYAEKMKVKLHSKNSKFYAI